MRIAAIRMIGGSLFKLLILVGMLTGCEKPAADTAAPDEIQKSQEDALQASERYAKEQAKK